MYDEGSYQTRVRWMEIHSIRRVIVKKYSIYMNYNDDKIQILIYRNILSTIRSTVKSK